MARVPTERMPGVPRRGSWLAQAFGVTPAAAAHASDSERMASPPPRCLATCLGKERKERDKMQLFRCRARYCQVVGGAHWRNMTQRKRSPRMARRLLLSPAGRPALSGDAVWRFAGRSRGRTSGKRRRWAPARPHGRGPALHTLPRPPPRSQPVTCPPAPPLISRCRRRARPGHRSPSAPGVHSCVTRRPHPTQPGKPTSNQTAVGDEIGTKPPKVRDCHSEK